MRYEEFWLKWAENVCPKCEFREGCYCHHPTQPYHYQIRCESYSCPLEVKEVL